MARQSQQEREYHETLRREKPELFRALSGEDSLPLPVVAARAELNAVELYGRVLDRATEYLLRREEIDKLVEDDATRFARVQ